MNLKDEPYLVEQIKDQVCYVADDVEVEMRRAFPKKSEVSLEFVLPDGVHNERGFVQNPRDPEYVFDFSLSLPVSTLSALSSGHEGT
jgi:hypothetical protein